jgi:Tfp pilus assembly PilM family ATPase/Tfp pilus assembly protein PilN
MKKLNNLNNELNKFFSSIIKKLSSQPAVGGLEISDSAIRFLHIKGEKITKASLRLPPGIILNGKINDRQNFLSALKTLYSQLIKSGSGSRIHTIVCLPAPIVFSQSFNIPQIERREVEEAAELNLRMVSPISPEKSYSDWQLIGEDLNQINILGAFVENVVVDDYDRCLRECGFLPVAFEFPALSLTRLIKDLGPTIDAEKSYLIISISTEGLNLLILRNGQLYFSHFIFWRTLQGEKRQIIFSDFKEILSQEVQKIVNFLSVNYKESFEGVIVITSALEKEIGEIIKKEFDLNIIPLQLKRYAAEVSAMWFTAFGSALRGLLPRRQDTYISLTAHNVIEEYYHGQTLSFIALWRNVLAVSLLVLLITFSGVDIFLIQIKRSIDNQLSSLTSRSQAQELSQLQQKANTFNQLVGLVSNAKNSIPEWSPFFQQLNGLAGSEVVYDKIIVPSLGSLVTIQGRATSEQAVISFKNSLISQPNFEKVNLPLTSIHPTPDRKVTFQISFSIKSLTP